MTKGNRTTVTEFVLMGFTDRPELQLPLSVVFLVIYLITLVGNLGMILLIRADSRLHTPMYYFLSHLAFIDLCYSSSIGPKMLQNLLVKKKTISFSGCFAQLYFSGAFATTGCFLLPTMAYDRYVAICNPNLHSYYDAAGLQGVSDRGLYLWLPKLCDTDSSDVSAVLLRLQRHPPLLLC